MRIRFVTEPESRSWILRPLAECLAAEVPGSDVGTEPLPWADFNVFFNYALYKPVDTKTAALFTHREEGKLGEKFDLVAKFSDWCFAQSYNTLEYLPRHKSSVMLTYPTRSEYYRDIVIGVCGRAYRGRRKRFQWLQDIEEIPGVQVKLTGGKLDREEMIDFYESIDYLLVTSSNEGGPQPVLEAISMGVPVISPNVGYCWEYPGYRYYSKQGLLELLADLVIPKDGWKIAAAEFLRDLEKC